MKRSFAVVVALLVILGSCRFYRRFRNPNLVITFFDVGQGDSALIQLPYGKNILVDAGGGFQDWDLGTRELFPELARLGILHLDVALLSHPDQDHGYGFLGIFKNLEVGQFWFNDAFLHLAKPHPLLQKLQGIARERNIAVHTFGVPEVQDWEGVKLKLFPLNEGKTNNRTLVLSLVFGECSALFTGDIESEGELALSKYKLSHLTLLKVAHHGSHTSSTPLLLSQLRPRFAVISVGINNRYHHPRPEIISRLRAGGTQTFRTDFHGFVRWTFTPQGNLWCENAQGPCGAGLCSIAPGVGF